MSSRLRRLSVGRAFIADNRFEAVSLSRVAAQSSMSPSHFLRLFSDVYGETPNEFLIRLRVEQAKAMLVTESASVSDICERVGYTSLGSFSSLFSKRVGMAPTAYRRRLWAMSAEHFRFPVQAIPACYAFHFLGKAPN